MEYILQKFEESCDRRSIIYDMIKIMGLGGKELS